MLQKYTANDMATTIADGTSLYSINCKIFLLLPNIKMCAANVGNKNIQGTLNELKDMETTVNKTVTIMKSLGEDRNRIYAFLIFCRANLLAETPKEYTKQIHELITAVTCLLQII